VVVLILVAFRFQPRRLTGQPRATPVREEKPQLKRTGFIRFFFPTPKRGLTTCPKCQTPHDSIDLVCKHDDVMLMSDTFKKRHGTLMWLLRVVLMSVLGLVIYLNIIWPLYLTMAILVATFLGAFLRKQNSLRWIMGTAYVVGLGLYGLREFQPDLGVSERAAGVLLACVLIGSLPFLMLGFAWRLKPEKPDGVRWPYVSAVFLVVSGLALWGLPRVAGWWPAWRLEPAQMDRLVMETILLILSGEMTLVVFATGKCLVAPLPVNDIYFSSLTTTIIPHRA
jgi:hypothetical protein